ncbi:MAG: Crp/Fnr family transcriptional regulator [Arcobacteraceae bacterium]
MFDIQNALKNNILFKDFNNQEINSFLVSSRYRTEDYKPGQIIAIEGDPLSEIGLILNGTLEVQKHYPSGKTVVIDQIEVGKAFGEIAIFTSMKNFPSTILTITDSKIMFINKNNILKICFQNEKFLRNLLFLLSEKIILLNNRLKFLSRETIRQKICVYLLEIYQKKKNLHITVPVSREKMAEQFGITRPSLSRELGKMVREGLISIKGNNIIIKQLSLLEDYI